MTLFYGTPSIRVNTVGHRWNNYLTELNLIADYGCIPF